MVEFDQFDLAVIKDCIDNKHHMIMYDIQNSPEPIDHWDLMEIEANLSELARVYEKVHEKMYGEKVVVTLS